MVKGRQEWLPFPSWTALQLRRPDRLPDLRGVPRALPYGGRTGRVLGGARAVAPRRIGRLARIHHGVDAARGRQIGAEAAVAEPT